MLPNILQIMTKAVKERRCVAIRYHDQRQIRVLEPHAIYTDDHGELVLDGFQTRGYSSSGRPTPFWRPFRLKKITAISVLKETFEPRTTEGFSPQRLKYQNHLVAIVEEQQAVNQNQRTGSAYSIRPVETGPFLPLGMRRG
jgi:predicted DNA-binding transcriptional regulator YafY